jgi:hypothetical protein
MRFPSRGQRCVVTDQRNRITTDPGLGPVGIEHPTTLRSMAAAAPVTENEDHCAPVYYEPKPLNAACDHKTLELETVKLSKDIDPRKLPTEVKLRRPVLHVLPASDPNWPAPVAPPELPWPPLFDSGWPPPETVLTTSQPPQAPRRRSLIPLVLLALLGGTVLLLVGANARRRSAVTASAAQGPRASTLPTVDSQKKGGLLPHALPAATSRESATAARADSPTAEATSVIASAAESPPGAASVAPARPPEAPRHTSFKPNPPSASVANSRALSAPSSAKPKRAIY